ncbi:hypothetical protein ERJ77_21615 [Vibrio anguillarum]|uniref:Conjugal transfer protein TraN n=1 Tax=Vibrio anguillarum TaxID=55601 RepID=A0AAW4BGF3_VIBAN|nr:hypothetical protein [Vibrio anguillarum]
MCSKLKEVKQKTIDQVINEINTEMPDKIFEDISGKIDLNKPTSPSGNGTSTPSTPPNSNGETQSKMCYTRDAAGKTITVPCDIAEATGTPDQCYLREGNVLTGDFKPVACSRPTIDNERCVIGYQKDKYGRVLTYSDGVAIPIIDSCGVINIKTRNNACLQTVTSNGSTTQRAVSCSVLSEPVTQYNRMCSGTKQNSTGNLDNVKLCIDVDLACYGHMNGIFKTAQCRDFSAAQIKTKTKAANGDSDPYANFKW